jgi:hypothetical protein
VKQLLTVGQNQLQPPPADEGDVRLETVVHAQSKTRLALEYLAELVVINVSGHRGQQPADDGTVSWSGWRHGDYFSVPEFILYVVSAETQKLVIGPHASSRLERA